MDMANATLRSTVKEGLMDVCKKITSQQNINRNFVLSTFITRLLTVLLKKMSETLKETRQTTQKSGWLENQLEKIATRPNSSPAKAISWAAAAKLPAKPSPPSPYPSVLTQTLHHSLRSSPASKKPCDNKKNLKMKQRLN